MFVFIKPVFVLFISAIAYPVNPKQTKEQSTIEWMLAYSDQF